MATMATTPDFATFLSEKPKYALQSALKKLAIMFGEEAVINALESVEGDKSKNETLAVGSIGKKEKKKKREFDISNYKQRHIAIRLMYDGREYAGFAAQDESGNHKSDKSRKPRSKKNQFGGQSASSSSLSSSSENRLETVEKHLAFAFGKTRLFASTNQKTAGSDSGQAELVEEGDSSQGDGLPKLVSGSGYSRCGRTDRGVSALGQVIALPLRSNFPPEIPNELLPNHPLDLLDISTFVVKKTRNQSNVEQEGEVGVDKEATVLKVEADFCTTLNSVLPLSIRAIGYTPVTDKFSARFSASSRTYRYFFIRRNLDLAAMAEAAQSLVGDHDFRNLCKIDAVNVSNFRRVIKSFTLHKQRQAQAVNTTIDNIENRIFKEEAEEDQRGGAEAVNTFEEKDREVWYFQVEGQAFLWHQVRCMVAILFFIGEKKEEPSIIKTLLSVESTPEQPIPLCPRKPQYPMANEEPLVLQDCGYSNLDMQYTPMNLWGLSACLEEQWNNTAIKLAQLKNSIEDINSLQVRRQDVQEAFDKRYKPKTSKKSKEGKNEKGHVSEVNQNTKEEDDDIDNQRLAKRSRTEIVASSSNQYNEAADLDTNDNQNPNGEMMLWRDALKLLGGVEAAPGVRRHHVPLMQREGAKTLEEKVSSLQGKNKERLDYHKNMKEKSKLPGNEDMVFFSNMRKEGNL